MAKKLKKTDIIELNEAYQKVLIWFWSFPLKELTLNELSKAVNISKTTANKIVTKLLKEGFLTSKTVGKGWLIKCNLQHHYNHTRKVCYNLAMIFESEILTDIKDIFKNPRAIILFGSYRKGDDTEKSDVDIAVEILGNEKLKIQELGTLPKLGYRGNTKVNLHVFSRNKIDLNLFANIANGIVLEGFLEVQP